MCSRGHIHRLFQTSQSICQGAQECTKLTVTVTMFVSPPPRAAHGVVVLVAMWPVVADTAPIVVASGSVGEIRFFAWIGHYAGGRESNESENVSEEHCGFRWKVNLIFFL